MKMVTYLPAAGNTLSWPTLQTVAMVAVMLLDIRVCAQASNCQYKYTEQPRPNPNCDPYDAGELIIECTVVVPPDASNISIGWFFNCDQLHNNSDITITSQAHNTTIAQNVRSRLTIVNMSDRYAGKYTCNLLGHEEFLPSDLFRLPTESELLEQEALGPCGANTIQSIEGEECVKLTQKMTIPMSLTCTEPVMTATSSSDITMTSTTILQGTTTLSFTSTSLSLARSTSISLGHPPPSSIPPSTQTPTMARRTYETTSGADIIWLYVMIAVAALLFLVLIVVVILYLKKCIRTSHTTIHKDLQHEAENTIAVVRNPLYGTSSGGPTPSNGMQINEGYGAQTADCSTTTDPVHMRISEVYGIQTQESKEELGCRNTDMEASSQIYDYIPVDSAGNTTRLPATADIPATDTNPLNTEL